MHERVYTCVNILQIAALSQLQMDPNIQIFKAEIEKTYTLTLLAPRLPRPRTEPLGDLGGRPSALLVIFLK